MKKRNIALGAAVAVLAGLYAVNNSWSAPKPEGGVQLLAHRGMHHTFSREGLTRQSCTASKIHPPTHDFIENTLPSMRKAFELGADMVEVDVHPTTDGEFAVFHDWTIDCRTEGKGVTRRQTMAYLKTLDVGWGYTADGGETFPLRGKGVGLMPTLDEVLRAFPDKRIVVNVKSNDRREGDLLHAYLSARPHARPERLVVNGGWKPSERLKELNPSIRVFTKQQMKRCMQGYLLTGWTGRLPAACRDTVVYVPVEQGWLLWGWPNRFIDRMEKGGSEVWLGGSVDWKVKSLVSIDDAETARRIPKDFDGVVQTDRIEVVGPVLKPQPQARP
ncbi:MAG TPA: glycerophosphodiester phosphodiesterase family protein [Caulobacteraceae bacterium]|nr:glycerophosphodiester phosphodiesterase family protein [Caulobacteraceae bacterium]